MLNVRGCDFSSDSLDDHGLTGCDGSPSQRDSSTIMSEFSSTRTLMNIDSETRRAFEDTCSPKKFYFSKRYSEESVLDDNEIKTTFSQETVTKTSVSIKRATPDSSRNKVSKGKLQESKVAAKSESKTKHPLRKRVVGKPQSPERHTSPKRSVRSCNSDAKSLSSPSSPRPKRDSSGNILTSESSSSTPAKKSKHDMAKSLPGGIKREKSSFSPTPKSPRTRSSTTQSSSPTRAKRPRTSGSRETSQSPSPTRRRASTPSRTDSPSPTEKASRGGSFKLQENHEEHTMKDRKKKMKFVLDFDEFPPPKSERTMRSCSRSDECEHVEVKQGYLDFAEAPPTSFYLSPIEENSEASSTSSRSKLDQQSQYPRILPDQLTFNQEEMVEEPEEYYSPSRKYHTYPKSRIPVLKRLGDRRLRNLMDPRLYPLEPREIDIEGYQQLHTADSQEELQEFLLLEGECSGNLGLAGNVSSSEMFYYDEPSDDERGTMSGIYLYFY